MADQPTSRRRTAISFTGDWYVAARHKRPPTIAEVVHDLTRRAMADGQYCWRLLTVLLAVTAVGAGATVLIVWLAPPSFWIMTTVAAGGLIGRRRLAHLRTAARRPRTPRPADRA